MLFADTFCWIALTNPRDSAHYEVMQFTAKLPARAVSTTDEVLTEFLAYCSSNQKLREQAGLAVSHLMNDPDIIVFPQSRSSFLDGLSLYNSRRDKKYSLTDCISMQIMRREGLKEALTNDQHFEQEGFHAVFRRF